MPVSSSVRGATQPGGTRDEMVMRHALELAVRGWGRVAPNPLVGAVVTREGRVVGTGFHREFGSDHAEVLALRAAGERARGGTLHVNLEPCDHHGKTPPCTQAIREAGVRRVVIGCPDPSPEAAGGSRTLRSAGIEVTEGVAREEAERLNAPFLWFARRATPWVAVKLAMSLDGRIAGAAGTRTPVTGREAREEVQRLRAGFDAILVGRETVAVDDPELTVRGPLRPRRAPARIVLDSRLRTGAEVRLLTGRTDAPVIVVCGPDAEGERERRLEDAGASVLRVGKDERGGLDLAELLAALASREIRTVLVEGGGRTVAPMLRADIVRRLYLFRAPVTFGEEGVPAFPEPGAFVPDRWRLHETRCVGADALSVLDRVEQPGDRT
ncbi:MAG: bifunctional diaminohydroxyphosphoribosylaminopyrimidine deaminase/5-amino-6-(5-phosphoribosylamino)uracil reductase RibD [Gemmatimonadota bacterium]